MKKALLLLLLVSAKFISAQYCGTLSGPTVCTPGGLTAQGITDYTTFPCVHDSVPYNEVIQVFFPQVTTVLGQTVTITSVRIDSISNLPCGLCWSCNDSTFTYAGGTGACIRISGTTDDLHGAYKLSIIGTAVTSFGTFPGSLENLGYQFFLNVVGKNDPCGPVNITALKTACSVLHPANKCDFDVVVNSSVALSGCNFDSTVLTVAQPSGANFGYKWAATYGVFPFGTRLDSAQSMKVYDTDNLITLIVDSAGCKEELIMGIDGSGPVNRSGICYTTFDSSVAATNTLQIVFQKDNWFNNITRYTLNRQDFNTGLPHFIDSISGSDQGIFTDVAPIDWTFLSLNSNTRNIYSLNAKTVCPDTTGTTYYGQFIPTVLRVDSTGGGYPLLVWSKGTTTNYEAMYIYNRYPGGSWRLRLATNTFTDSTWIDLRPDSTAMQYMLGFKLKVVCDPARAAATTAFSNFDVANVPPGFVVRDTTVIIPTSLGKSIDAVRMAVYPNPASDNLYLQVDMADADALNFKMYNMFGQIVSAQKIKAGETNSISVAELSGGVYTISLHNGSKQLATKRFVKQ